jgi:lysophospholipase L1-like esterase
MKKSERREPDGERRERTPDTARTRIAPAVALEAQARLDSRPHSARRAHMNGKRSSRPLRLASGSLGLLLGLVALELALRLQLALSGPDLEQASRSAAPRLGGELRLIDLIRPSRNRRLVYELRPALWGRYAGAPVSINAEGLRDAELPRRKEPGELRIALLGDSCAFGQGVAAEQALSEQLEAFLQRRFGGGGRRFEVLNFGVPGYNTAMEAELLRSRVLDFEPDAIVLLYVGNDVDLPNFIRAESDAWTFGRSFLLDRLAAGLRRVRGEQAVRPAPASGLVGLERHRQYESREAADWVPQGYRWMVGWDAVLRALRQMAELARSKGLPRFILCHNAHVNAFVGRGLSALRQGSSELYRVARDFGWTIADPLALQVLYLEQTGQSQSVYWVQPRSDPHPSPLLHRLMALRVYQALAAEAVVPGPVWSDELPVAEQLGLFAAP